MSPRSLEGKRCLIAGLFSAKRNDLDAAVAEVRVFLTGEGAVVVGQVIQRRGVSRARKAGGVAKMDAPMNAATIIGKGKVDELRALAAETGADTVVFWNSLSATQQARLEEATGCRVLGWRIFHGKTGAS